ncbi:MAG TPA: efflux RND transporter periplasmic adaptor subunit [Candidatus Polarisedimenticolia bacterium]|nr:efflux RND transporter periplasmic adaptor subunit [Candidatus Polarisedimenticolia bacterium]
MDEIEPSRSRRKYWILAGVLTAVAVAAYFGLSLGGKKSELTYETAKVDCGRIVAKVTATGTLSPLVTVQVGSQVSGRIQALYADFNSTVKKGEVVAKIDPQLFEAEVRQARANLSAAQGNLTKSKAQALDSKLQYERAQSLAKQNLVAEADLDTARANAEAGAATVTASEGGVEQARASLHQAQINLAYTTIYSPTDGTVISRSVDVGQTVAASLQAPTLFTIAEDLRKMQVDSSVAEADVGRLQPGMEATFFVDAFPSERFTGTVRQIRNAPQTVQNVVTYDAVLDVSNPDLKLKPGMTANITFVTAERAGVLRVPNAALRFRPPPEMAASLRDGAAGETGGRTASAAGRGKGRGGGGGGPGAGGGRGGWGRGGTDGGGEAGTPDRKTVWVLRDDKPVRVPFRAGVTDGSVTEMTEGQLREGDKVITAVTGGVADRSGQQGGPGNSFRRVF